MKKLYFLLAILFLCVTLAGCDAELTDIPVKSSQRELTLSGEPSTQGCIYYSDGNSVRRIKSSGFGDKPFTDFYSVYLFVIDDWVYYYDRENHPEHPDPYYGTCPIIHRRKEDGTQDEQISEIPVSRATCKDGYIYYTPYYGSSDCNYGYGLYRMNADGSDSVQIIPDSINTYYFDGGYIYIELAGSSIIRTNMDGGERTDIMNGYEYSAIGISDMVFDDEYIYFLADLPGEYLDNRYLYRTKKDGSEKQQLTDISTNDFALSGDYIYFIGSEDTISDRYLYKMTADGGEPHRIGLRNVSYDQDYLEYDGEYIYVHLSSGYKYDPVGGSYETSRLYKIHCDR